MHGAIVSSHSHDALLPCAEYIVYNVSTVSRVKEAAAYDKSYLDPKIHVFNWHPRVRLFVVRPTACCT